MPLFYANKMSRFLTFLVLFFTAFSAAQDNTVVIIGKTNVNTFTCTNTNFSSSGLVSSITSKKLPNLVLKVNNFDCKNRIMTSDFRKTLNAEKYPNMQIRFLKFSQISSTYYKGTVEVNIMNRKKNYDITFFSEGPTLVGNRKVKFSDFGIVPPKRMAGTIVVKDDLDLTFTLR